MCISLVVIEHRKSWALSISEKQNGVEAQSLQPARDPKDGELSQSIKRHSSNSSLHSQ